MKGMNMSADDKTVKYAKLEWYKEVVSLEPNSKLFLPLARLLAELGTEDNNADLMNEAFDVLRRGLDIQPDFMEARLFLIELLNICGCKAQCGAEVARLASLFLSYPDFWDAWREYAITENESSDFTVALGFMSAIMRNKSLSIVQVLEAGLNSIKTSASPVFSAETVNAAKNIGKNAFAKTSGVSGGEPCVPQGQAQKTARQDNVFEVQEYAEEPADLEDFSDGREGDTAFGNGEEDDLSVVLPKSHVENYVNFAEQQEVLQEKTKSTKETLAELIKDANITVEPLENSPFRTKSMADLLAEQGDYKGALEIYQELLARGYGNKEELEERIADVKMLAPELNIEIDKSKLLAIDDLVDTSFGTMAKSLSTLEAASADMDVIAADTAELEANAADFAENAAEDMEAAETAENLLAEETAPAAENESDETLSFDMPADIEGGDIPDFAENQENTAQENMPRGAEETVQACSQQTAQSEENPKSRSDVADLLTKLAERLEVRAK